MKTGKRKLTKSNEYLKRAEQIIPSLTQTLSKGPTQFVQGVAPTYLERGRGSHVWDVDGNEYIDYVMALGPVILGYNYPRVNEAITQQLKKGISFSLMHPLEVELAELLAEVIPCAEMVRFSKNGADVTTAAIRVSRAYTGREKIAQCGYHGWLDWTICTTTRDKGVPKQMKNLTLPFKYGSIETLEKIFDENKNEIAAVIMEPIGIEEPSRYFLEKIEELTHENGALLIFDEIVTGFRMALGGAQEYFGVTPDLACFGKAMANGMPLSTIVGKKEVMKEFQNVFFSLTFGGETLSLAASLATINEIKEKNVIEHIWKQGNKLKDGYNELAKKFGIDSYTKCLGWGPRTIIQFLNKEGNEWLELKSLFQQEVVKRNILWIYHLLSYSHSDEDIKKTLEAYAEALAILKKAINEGNIEKYLEGKKVQPVFREP
jgi:glutamate-1-semialdehyde aminotransferase